MKKLSILMMVFLLCASIPAEATNFNQLEAGETEKTKLETSETEKTKLEAGETEKTKPEAKPWRSVSFSSNFIESTLTFTNGKQYNKHFFLGYGMGIDYTIPMTITINDPIVEFPNGDNSLEVGGFSVPVFLDGRMRVFKSWISPAVRLRTGIISNFSHPAVGGFIFPEIALDITRYVSFSLGWIGQAQYRFDLNDWVRQNSPLYLGLAVNF